MRRITLIVFPLTLALGSCSDKLPTDAVMHPLDSSTRFALVDGPVTPINGGVITSPVVTIANSADREEGPRISGDGDLVCYNVDPAGSARTRYYRFSSAVNSAIPGSGQDRECAADGNRVTFGRVFPGGSRSGIMLFDVSTSTLSELDPQPDVFRRFSAIAGNTVLFLQNDQSLFFEARVIDLAAPNQSQLLSSTASPRNYSTPNLSPDGNVAVWVRCDSGLFPTNCDVMKAVRTAGTWGTPQLVTSSPDNEGSSDTDGSYIVWTSDLNNFTESDIYIQSVAGGPVTQLAIPGPEYSTSISSGVVTFQGPNAGGSYDVFAYVIATNRLYQITNTTPHEGLSDVAVLGNGDIRIVWDVFSSASDVYATTFTPPFSFGGFVGPVDNLPTINVAKAGAAIPVKFSLGGDRGLTIFASGSPSSVAVTCDASAPTGTVEETVTAGNSALSYDATTDTYSYIWKTDKTWANTCRRLTLQFVDGTVANADFQFTK